MGTLRIITNMFQFQYGAINTKFDSELNYYKNAFQFQYGAINIYIN